MTITTEGATVIGFDGTPAEGKHYHVDWDAAAAEKGGYDTFMEKEIHDQPHAVADTLLGRTDESGRLVLDELRISEEDLRSVDKMVIVACGTAAYAGHGRQVRDRALDPDPVRGRAGARVPLPRPGGRRAHAGGLDLPVRGDHGHPDGGQARPRAGRPDHRHLQHPRLDHPARVRRRALHPRRPRDRGRVHQGVPGPDHRLLHPRALPRPAARRHVRRRGPGRHEGPARGAGQAAERAGQPRPGPRDRPVHGRHPLGALPRPPRRLPGRDGGRAQAQGAGLHPRRGLRRRRAQARPDRADRARAAGLRRRARRPASSTGCTARSSPTSRRSAPAAPAPW